MEYLKDPAAIYAKSFATIRAEVDFSSLPNDVALIAERMIHASGMVDLIDDIRFTEDVVRRASEALTAGMPILCDCEMVRSGIIPSLMCPGVEVKCFLNEQPVLSLAASLKNTRSAAQVDLWKEELDGAVVVIGNAPTCLFRLLENMDRWDVRPAAIFAMPVGFVGAAEAKAALVENPRNVPFLTVAGRRGGSAMASASINAVGKLAQERRVA